jgi:hypothetical protein
MTRRTVSTATVAILLAAGVSAHTSLPASLELKETAPGFFELTFRIPVTEGAPPAIFPVLPEHCSPVEDPAETSAPTSVFTRANVACGDRGLSGQTIGIEGLRMTIMDVVVRIVFADGSVVTKILRPHEPSFTVSGGSARGTDTAGYALMGVAHILGGIDHLLFVAGILLIVRGTGRLLKAITAFTVAHSITLALAVLGLVRFSPPPVEAVIALSLVFVAVELSNHHRGIDGLTYRRPWLVAFSFGLLHGFGFAGTLSSVGIPAGEIPRALLSFNIGVEAGQLLFIAAFAAAIRSVGVLQLAVPRWAAAAPSYAIGTLASYWFLQRCMVVIVK